MPDKLMRIRRADEAVRPIMIAIAGDSAAGKTTLTRGLVAALGSERSISLCVDDYHRYDRAERRSLPFTPLHPSCNYVQIMEQHLRLLALGRPILKPVYDHGHGELIRPELVEPHPLVIVEGLLPLHTKLLRACFDVTVYLSPPEEVRRQWKIARDTLKRGYTHDQVISELERREPEADRYVRPQRRNADIVVEFARTGASVLLRPTIRHPDFARILSETGVDGVTLALTRDPDGIPADALHISRALPTSSGDAVAAAIWDDLGKPGPLPDSLGLLDGTRDEPLRLVQLILLYHLLSLMGVDEWECVRARPEDAAGAPAGRPRDRQE
ncbi:phosphoribulokinase [Sphaerisporangium perillae]|uniref:phosphoribulokinase n=1 Tax=Sphaerisporangium perillae TaxID=2935860 RepID=UPI00200F4AED|nr:phosphoribulokinase [Sphaerisporangium perillae]